MDTALTRIVESNPVPGLKVPSRVPLVLSLAIPFLAIPL